MKDIIRASRRLFSRIISRTSGRGFASSRRMPPVARLMALPLIPAAVLAAHYAVVRPGDTLSGIAQAQCGNAADWTGIYTASRHVVGSDPDLIYPGQRLTVDCRQAAGVTPPSAGDKVVTTRSGSPRHYSYASPPRSGTSVSYQRGYYDPSAAVLSEPQIEELWVSAGGPSWAAYAAYRVTQCESGGNRYAYNPSGATGLWQILGAVVSGNLYDARVNALNAVAKFTASGDTWAQWVCQP